MLASPPVPGPSSIGAARVTDGVLTGTPTSGRQVVERDGNSRRPQADLAVVTAHTVADALGDGDEEAGRRLVTEVSFLAAVEVEESRAGALAPWARWGRSVFDEGGDYVGRSGGRCRPGGGRGVRPALMRRTAG